MSGDKPPSYDDALMASAPPQDGGMNMPPYPTQPPAPYPTPPQQGYPAPQPGYAAPPQGYPTPQQGYHDPQKGYPAPQQGYATPPQQGYPTAYPPQNYGAAPSPAYPQQHPPQVQPAGTGQYNYNTVTVISPQGQVTTAPVAGYAPIAPTSQQLQAQQRSRKRLCIVTIFLFVGIIGFGTIAPVIGRNYQQRNRRLAVIGFIIGAVIFILIVKFLIF